MENAERYLINKSFRPAGMGRRVLVGVGDDAAVVRTQRNMILSTDTLVCGVHFDAECDPFLLGRKALAVNLSDLAAMGADPEYALLSIALPVIDEPWLDAFSKGLRSALEEYRVELIGGDLAGGPNLSISITVTGSAASMAWRPLRLDGARQRDELWVSGAMGQAAAEFAATAGLGSDPKSRLLNPQPRLALGRALVGKASAATDLSDGLLHGLEVIARQAQCAALVDWDLVPLAPAVAALGDIEQQVYLGACWGEDYELLFTVPPGHDEDIGRIAEATGLKLSKIGALEEGMLVLFRRGEKLLKLQSSGQRFTHVGANLASDAAVEVYRRAKKSSLKVAAGESCTSGLVAARLAAEPGSSAVFAGGVVAYTAEAKEKMLVVPQELISEHGIVSELVALAMAHGARRQFGADAAVATTGWAGPDGGDGQDPGTVWLAALCRNVTLSSQLKLQGGREQVKLQAVAQALRLLADTMQPQQSG